MGEGGDHGDQWFFEIKKFLEEKSSGYVVERNCDSKILFMIQI